MARDGYSGKIIAATVMPLKNNERIYENIYKVAAIEYGLWDQLRVDHGKEFYLSLYVHEELRKGRGDPTIPPYVQTTSTCNHKIERIWVELNVRVTYPIKRIIKSMDDCRTINVVNYNQISLYATAEIIYVTGSCGLALPQGCKMDDKNPVFQLSINSFLLRFGLANQRTAVGRSPN